MTTQTKATKLEEQVRQDFVDIISRLAKDDPSWGRFLTYSPAYRYFSRKGSNDQYFWTTDKVKHNGKLRFASGIYRYIKTRKAYKLTNQQYHAKRKDAKARASKLHEVIK